jgi:hypothetical protein
VTFRVHRHGGRAHDHWREVFSSEDRARAEARYAKAAEQMRQGGVRLVEDDPGSGRNLEIAHRWAPTLRTRW